MKPDTWMPLHIGEYLADTMHLDNAQNGSYLLLIMAYWRNGGPLNDFDAALGAVAKCSPLQWKKMREVLAPFFRIEGGKWHHKRIDHELAHAAKKQARSSAGGHGKAASKQDLSSPQADDKHVLEPCLEAAPLPRPLPIDDDESAGARDPGREVLEAIGVWGDARWFGNGALVAAWMSAGADLDLDILPAVKGVMAKRGSQDPPSSLKYFDRPVMDAFATRTTPARPGKANGTQANRQDRSDRSAKLREAAARTFRDVAGEPHAD